MITLRPYQEKILVGARIAYRNGARSPLVVAPTGSGKTITFSAITQNHLARSPHNRVLALSHRVELMEQASAAFHQFGVNHGLINPNYTPNYEMRAQIGTISTVVNRLGKLYPPTLIIVDEGHHGTANTYKKILQYFPQALVLGLTATPVRADGSPLGDVYDAIVEGPTVSELVENGYLVKPRYFSVSSVTDADLGAVRVSKGDFVRTQLGDVMDKPSITGDAVEHYRKYAHGLPAVAFCVSIKHTENVAADFRAAGYRAAAVHGKMDKSDRTRILKGLGSGLYDVVTSCDVISEGTDIPSIGCVIFLRPTKSLGLYIQQAGRGLRPCEGQDECIILDHVGNYGRHGCITEERVWTLEGKKKRKRLSATEAVLKVWECPSCYAINTVGRRDCVGCGEIRQIKARKIEERAGELVEIVDKGEAARIKKVAQREVNAARTMDELLVIEKARGYKRGWAHRKFKSRKKSN